jgi:hypothetical protein
VLVWTQRLEERIFASAGDRSPLVQSVVRHYTGSYKIKCLAFIFNELYGICQKGKETALRTIFEPKEQEDGGNYVMMSFMVCRLHVV